LQIAKYSENALTNMMLNACWCPRDITISEWYFKGKDSDAADVNANADRNEINGKSFIGGGIRHVLSSDCACSSIGNVPFTSTCSTTGNVQSSLSAK
jgi:hypothetical protein